MYVQWLATLLRQVLARYHVSAGHTCMYACTTQVTFRHRLRDAQTGTSSTLGPDGLPEPKPLLIKSPVHTARARLFLKLLPHARFVHIHRNPLQVCMWVCVLVCWCAGVCFLICADTQAGSIVRT